MRRSVARSVEVGFALMLCLVLAAVGSFWHARAVADQFIGPPTAELQPFQVAPIPIGRHPVTNRWGWVFAYGNEYHEADKGALLMLAALAILRQPLRPSSRR